MTANIVELRNVQKNFGAFTALSQINLQVKRGEILTLLGPSGCGKTTLMRIVAGFEFPTAGDLLIDEKVMSEVPPEQRPVNMVFQRYALFPHLDIFDNVAFGLRLKGMKSEQIRSDVTAMLKLVQLDGFANRWIGEISGGQAQRVALARALVNRPAVLLLDEPLAALDLKIRHHMLDELKRIHTETGTTFIYVTHDQDEAMILSDRVALMNKGRIEQIGTPDEMYGHPKTVFCAKFFGDSNFATGAITVHRDGNSMIDSDLGPVVAEHDRISPGAKVHVSIRPEVIRIADAPQPRGDEPNTLVGQLQDIDFIGSRVVYKVRDHRGTLVRAQEQRSSAGIRFHVGSQVKLTWDASAVTVIED